MKYEHGKARDPLLLMISTLFKDVFRINEDAAVGYEAFQTTPQNDWRLHTRLCKFARNISTNIPTLGQRTFLILGNLSLFIFCNITIS